MVIVGKLTEAEKLELYRVALSNAKSNPRIMEILNQNGISTEIMEEGSKLLSITNEAVVTADLARTERSKVYKGYSKLLADIIAPFLTYKKKAQMAFLYDQAAQDKLNLNSRSERGYVKTIGRVKSFYTKVSTDQDISEQLAKFGLSTENVNGMLASISVLEQSRADYINEKGISQDATNAKQKALGNLNKWMARFIALAKDTLKQHPQLMEYLYVVVKN